MTEEQTSEEHINRTVIITMPKTYAEKFLSETKQSFLDCRYLNIMFKDKMFIALYNQQPEDVKLLINTALIELKKYRDEEIKGMAQQLSYYKSLCKNK